MSSLRRHCIGIGAGLLTLGFLAPVAAKDGAAIYEDTCGRCHGLLSERSGSRDDQPGVGSAIHLAVVLPQGPTLNGIVGRPAGIIEGYNYSKGMRAFAETGAVWDRETLDQFITNSRAFVKGTTMFLKMEKDDRQSVLDYLEQVARHKL